MFYDGCLFSAHSIKHHQILNNLGSRVTSFAPQIPTPHLQVLRHFKEGGGKGSFNLGEGKGKKKDVNNVAAVYPCGVKPPNAAATSGKWGWGARWGRKAPQKVLNGRIAPGPRKEKQASPALPKVWLPSQAVC